MDTHKNRDIKIELTMLHNMENKELLEKYPRI